MLDAVGYQPGVPALAKSADRLILVVGADSRSFRPARRPLELARRATTELVEFPATTLAPLPTTRLANYELSAKKCSR